MTTSRIHTLLTPADEEALWANVTAKRPGTQLTLPDHKTMIVKPSDSPEPLLLVGAPETSTRIYWARCRTMTVEGRAALRVGDLSSTFEGNDPIREVIATVRSALKPWRPRRLETYNPTSEHHVGRVVNDIFVGPDAAEFSRDGGVLADVSSNLYYRVL